MVRWTRENPFGAHLLNLLITIIIITLVGVFLSVKDDRREDKIDQIQSDSDLIKTTVLKMSKDTLSNE